MKREDKAVSVVLVVMETRKEKEGKNVDRRLRPKEEGGRD